MMELLIAEVLHVLNLIKTKLNWEETIKFIRTQPEFSELVSQAYFDEDLKLNVERFIASEEFKETLKLIEHYVPNAKQILDIGCGNGISSIGFALKGYNVTAVEPDNSETVGAGAIRKLKTIYELDNLEVYEAFAEDINFDSESFDIVYIRQAMHHANDLKKFITEASRVLKKGGVLITVRDHVIYNDKDKERFLERHPLHKFYGGENAYKAEEYENAMQEAGLVIVQKMKYYDSIINYFPVTDQELELEWEKEKKNAIYLLKNKIGVLANIPFIYNLYFDKIKLNRQTVLDESKIPGRLYSYVAKK